MKKTEKGRRFKIGNMQIELVKLDEKGRLLVAVTSSVVGFKMFLRLTRKQIVDIASCIEAGYGISSSISINDLDVYAKVREYYRTDAEKEMSYKYFEGPVKMRFITLSGQTIVSVDGEVETQPYAKYVRNFFSTSLEPARNKETFDQLKRCINEMRFNNW